MEVGLFALCCEVVRSLMILNSKHF